MKTQLTLAATMIAASSLSTAEIVVNDFLSFEGFVDMSYSTTNADADGSASLNGSPSVGADISESDNSFGLDQVEISWLFDFDPVTAQIDLQYLGTGTTTGTDVEQAFATYHFDNGGAITAGLYASMLGFEAFEPTGLYQYSFAYGLPQSTGEFTGLIPAPFDDVLGLVAGTVFPLPGYAQGVKYTYEGDSTFFGLSIQDGLNGYSGRLGGDSDEDGGGYGFEIAGAYFMDNGLSYFAGFAYETGDGYSVGPVSTGDTEAWVFNTYVTFETGAWIFAFEVNYGENEWDDVVVPGVDIETESLSALLMANFAYSEKASVTGRISYVDYEIEGGMSGFGSADADGELFKYTLAHNYAFTDNLLLVSEVSYTDGDGDVSGSAGNDTLSAEGDFEELLFAVELIFSF